MKPASRDPPKHQYPTTAIGLPFPTVKFIKALELFPDITLRAGTNF